MSKNQFSMFNIPNLMTTGNLLCGILSIVLSLNGRIDLAPYPIFLGAIFDFLDGFAARMFKQYSELGKQLDSLADMVTFGLAPGIMILVLMIYETGNGGSEIDLIYYKGILYTQADEWVDHVHYWFENMINNSNPNFLPLVALLIPVFSMFRLAKFNVDTRQSESFIGLPTPANTIFFTAFPLLLAQRFEKGTWQYETIHFIVQPACLIPLICVFSFLLISELPLFALKFKQFKFKGNEIRYIFLITCLIIIPLLMFWSIAIIVILYLLLSLIENLLKKKQDEI